MNSVEEDNMDEAKRKRLETAGWTIGSAEEFLDLSPEEAAFVELKLSLSRTLQVRRVEQELTQEELAKRIGSSQSRVAKMEASDPSVSVDLLIRALLATGTSREQIAAAIAHGGERSAA
jgi:DNA-binding XRE family transcriptional regulator